MRHRITYIAVLFASMLLLAAADDPLEYKLAVIEAGGYVPKDHITVARFRSLLKQLQAGYKEDAERIADITVWAQDSLKKDSPPYTFFLLNGDMELHRNRQILV